MSRSHRVHTDFYDPPLLRVVVPPPQTGRLKNGDVYTIELRDNAGTVVASNRWEAMYADLYPNGEGCDPSCRYTSLE